GNLPRCGRSSVPLFASVLLHRLGGCRGDIRNIADPAPDVIEHSPRLLIPNAAPYRWPLTMRQAMSGHLSQSRRLREARFTTIPNSRPSAAEDGSALSTSNSIR